MAYRWILFDADGTLYDFERASRTALRATCEQILHHFEPSYEQVYDRINTKIWRDLESGLISPKRLKTARFQRFFEALAIQGDPDFFGQRFLDNLADNAVLLDGAEDVVRQLANTVKLIIITNGLQSVQRRRFAQGTIGEHFADFVISEEVGAAKPSPRIFEVAFERMGNPAKNEVLIVGDSLTSDIRGGNNYGIDTCWYNPRRKVNDCGVDVCHEINALAELPAIVSRNRG